MKKYLACIALGSLVTFSSFAGTFVKKDTGMVSWNAEGKQKVGTVTVNRAQTKLELNNVTAFEFLRLTVSNIWNLPVGKIVSSEIKLNTMDERSSEVVDTLIKDITNAEIKAILPEVEVVNSEVDFDNVVCIEKGLFKKTLSCQANYTSTMLVQFVR